VSAPRTGQACGWAWWSLWTCFLLAICTLHQLKDHSIFSHVYLYHSSILLRFILPPHNIPFLRSSRILREIYFQ
jgi:hypothetical protein